MSEFQSKIIEEYNLYRVADDGCLMVKLSDDQQRRWTAEGWLNKWCCEVGVTNSECALITHMWMGGGEERPMGTCLEFSHFW